VIPVRCSKCGSELPPDAKYCGVCGRKVKQFKSMITLKEAEEAMLQAVDNRVMDWFPEDEPDEYAKVTKSDFYAADAKIGDQAPVGVPVFWIEGYTVIERITDRARRVKVEFWGKVNAENGNVLALEYEEVDKD